MRHFIAACALFFYTGLAAFPAHAEWRRAVSTHFVIYSEGSPEQIRAAVEKLERFDGLLRRLSPVPPRESPIRLTVYMPRTIDAISALIGVNRAAGFYVPTAAGPFMVAPRQDLSLSFDADVVLFHEYIHHFMLQNFATVYPPWFVEGYAELLSNVRFNRDGSITIGSFADHRARELALDPPPLATLMFENRRNLRGTNLIGYYANAWFLTHYLILSDARPGQLGRYIAALGEGRAPRQAAEQAFGGIEALQRDFLRYRRARSIPTVTIRFDQAPAVGPIRIETLSPGAEALVWQQARLGRGVDRDDIAGFVRRVRASAAESPTDPAALQLLADAEFLAKDYAAATRAIDSLLALQPESPRALLRKGLIEIQLLEEASVTDPARWAEARAWIRRANRAAPDDALILLENYRAFERQRAGRPPRNALEGLARAYELVPQDFRLRTRYAAALIQHGRFREAVSILGPVAYSAHSNPASEAAARVIDAIRTLPEGAAPPPLPACPTPERSARDAPPPSLLCRPAEAERGGSAR